MTTNFKTINQIIDISSRKYAESTAFIFRDEQITYKELKSRIEKCAYGLHKFGIKEGDTFAIIHRNSPEFVITCMALSRLGAIAVPINFLEKSDKISFIFNDATVSACLTSKEFIGNVRLAAEALNRNIPIFTTDTNTVSKNALKYSGLLKERGGIPKVKQAEDRTILLLYTAGTTGTSKGVMLTNRNLTSNIQACSEIIDLYKEDRFLCLLPMFHSFAWTTCVLLPLSIGASTLIIESIRPFEPIMKSIWKHKVSVFVGVPPIYSAIAMKLKGLKALFIKLLNPVRICISGAAALPVDVLKKFESTLGIPILEGYGLTEASPVVSFNSSTAKRKIGTVGMPLPGVKVEIIDDEEKPLGPNEVGEICVKGDNVMKGYYNNPAENKNIFTKDKWLKTGDLGKVDDTGYITIVDRKKDMIIVKGFNVYPLEIENMLLKHPSIAEAAVVGITDKTGDEIIKGFVVLKEGEKTGAPNLLKYCRDKLAAYKRPRVIEIREKLPKNALGKILKTTLRNETKYGMN